MFQPFWVPFSFLITKVGGIIGGHTPLEAAKELDASCVPCIQVDDLPDVEILIEMPIGYQKFQGGVRRIAAVKYMAERPLFLWVDFGL